jgi:hypothetical protein
LALHDQLVIVTKYQDPAFATALACQEPVIRVVCHDVGSDASWPSSPATTTRPPARRFP